MILNTLADTPIRDLQQDKIPFICIPTEATADRCADFLQMLGLVPVAESIAHTFENLSNWTYQAHSDIEITRVTDDKQLQQFDAISAQAFEHPETYAFKFLKPIMQQEDIQLYVAKRNEQPVGCGMLTLIDGTAGLYWGGVLTEYRKQGIATALTEYRMQVAKQHGYDSICAQNMPLSVNYYQRIGFQPVGNRTVYAYVPS